MVEASPVSYERPGAITTAAEYQDARSLPATLLDGRVLATTGSSTTPPTSAFAIPAPLVPGVGRRDGASSDVGALGILISLPDSASGKPSAHSASYATLNRRICKLSLIIPDSNLQTPTNSHKLSFNLILRPQPMIELVRVSAS